MCSPTGNGYVQGSSSFREDDARRNEIEENRRAAALARARSVVVPCPYCGRSSFGMDVDLCPVHGIGCA